MPKNTPLNAGDRCFTALRSGADVAKTSRDVLNVDFRRFFETPDGQSSYASYAIVTNPQAQGVLGAPVFVKRNGRYYVAGVLAATNEKGEGIVVTASIMAQTLLSNRNLTTVYRDQIAGKFDAAATDAEIDSAIKRLEILDREKAVAQDTAPAQTPQYSLLTDDQSVAVSLSEPTAAPDAFVELAAQNVDLPNRVELESALDGATGESSSEEEFPTSAKDAFARSEAAATALSDNAGFQFGEDAFPVADAFPRADEPTSTQEATPESAEISRSALALNDNFAAPNAASTLPEANAPLAQFPVPTPTPSAEVARNATPLDRKNQIPEQTVPVAQNNDALVASASPTNDTTRKRRRFSDLKRNNLKRLSPRFDAEVWRARRLFASSTGAAKRRGRANRKSSDSRAAPRLRIPPRPPLSSRDLPKTFSLRLPRLFPIRAPRLRSQR